MAPTEQVDRAGERPPTKLTYGGWLAPEGESQHPWVRQSTL